MSSYFVIAQTDQSCRVDSAGTLVEVARGTDFPIVAWPSAWLALLWPFAWIEAALLALTLYVLDILSSVCTLMPVVVGWLLVSVLLREIGKRDLFIAHLDACRQSYGLLLSCNDVGAVASTDMLRRALFARHDGRVVWQRQLTREMLLRFWTSPSVIEEWQSRAERRELDYLQIGHLDMQVRRLQPGTRVGPNDVMAVRFEHTVILALSSGCVQTPAHWEVAQAMLWYAWTKIDSLAYHDHQSCFIPLPTTLDQWSALNQVLRKPISKELWRKVVGNVEWLRD